MPQKIKSALQILLFIILLLAGIGKILRPTLDSRNESAKNLQEMENITRKNPAAIITLSDTFFGDVLISWITPSEYWVSAELIVEGEHLCAAWTVSGDGNALMTLKGREMPDFYYVLYVSVKQNAHQATRESHIFLSVDDKFHVSMPTDTDHYDFASHENDLFLQHTTFAADLNHYPQFGQLVSALRQGRNASVSVDSHGEFSQFSLSGSNTSFEQFIECLDHRSPSYAIYFNPPISFIELVLEGQ